MRFAIVAFLLAACGSSSSTDSDPPQRAPESQDAVPEVAGNGYGAVPSDRVEVVVSKTGMAVDGKPIVAIANGKVDPSELEGGAQGIKIVKLAIYASHVLEQYRTKHPGEGPSFAISIDPALTYRLLISTMFSIKSARTRHFAIVARSGGKRVALPITLPDKAPASGRGYATALVGRGDGSPRISGPGSDLGKQVQDAAGRGKTVEVKPPFKTITKQVVTPASTLTGDVVGGKIASAYITGIRRCASKKPGHHALELQFGIDPSGRAGVVKLTGETGEVADCLGGLIASWRFPIPKSGDVPTAVTATIGIELDVETPSKAPVPGPTHTKISEEDEGALADKLTSSPADDDKVAVMKPPPEDDRDRSVGLFVSIMKGEMIVWSVTALEGTLKEPRARIKLGATAMAELSKVLTEIVRRRWDRPDHPRAADTKRIVIQADGDTAIQVVAEVMGAVRAGPDGRELFPDIQLSSGFE